MNFKIGDFVMCINDSVYGNISGNNVLGPKQLQAGKVYKISRIALGEEFFYLENDPLSWSFKRFKPLLTTGSKYKKNLPAWF